MSGHTYQPKASRRVALAICLSLIMFGLAGLSAGLSNNGRAAAFGGSATATPTVTRTPITGALKNQLAWGGLGGGPFEMECEKEMLGSLRLPALYEIGRTSDDVIRRSDLQNQSGLCIFGVPYRSGFTVDLYRPDGTLVDHVAYRRGDSFNEIGNDVWRMQPVGKRGYQTQYATDFGRVPVIFLNLWLPSGVIAGRWHLTLSAPNGGWSGDFTVSPFPEIPVLQLNQPPVWRFPNASPLDSPKEKYVYSQYFTDPLKIGATLRIYGANFTPGSVPLIGVYLERLNSPDGLVRADLITPINTRANQRGEWDIKYTVPGNFPPGQYYLVVVLDPTTDSGHTVGVTFEYNTSSWQPCANTYASQLRAGMRAKVIEGQKANRLRSQPITSGSVIGSIPSGKPFDILDGPSCANNWVWWYVRAPNGKTGWTAEGDQNQRWLVRTW